MKIEAAKHLKMYGIAIGVAGVFFLLSLRDSGLTAKEATFWMWIFCGVAIIAVGINMWRAGHNRLAELYVPVRIAEESLQANLGAPLRRLKTLLANPQAESENRDAIVQELRMIWQYAILTHSSDHGMLMDFVEWPSLLGVKEKRDRFFAAAERLMKDGKATIKRKKQEIDKGS